MLPKADNSLRLEKLEILEKVRCHLNVLHLVFSQLSDDNFLKLNLEYHIFLYIYLGKAPFMDANLQGA